MNPYLLHRSLSALERLCVATLCASLLAAAISASTGLASPLAHELARSSLDLFPLAVAWSLADVTATDAATGEAIGASSLGIPERSRALGLWLPAIVLTLVAVVLSVAVRPGLEPHALAWADADSARGLRAVGWETLSQRGSPGSVEQLRRISEPALGLVIGWLASRMVSRGLRRPSASGSTLLAARVAALLAALTGAALVWLVWTLSLAVGRGL